MEGIRVMLRWLGDRLPFVPNLPPPTSTLESKHRQDTLDRADLAIKHADDQWARVIKEGWGLWDDKVKQ